MFDVKPALFSTGLAGGLAAMLAGIVQIMGYAITSDDQAAMTNLISQGFILITGIMTLVSGAVAFWGRWTATRRISGVIRPGP